MPWQPGNLRTPDAEWAGLPLHYDEAGVWDGFIKGRIVCNIKRSRKRAVAPTVSAIPNTNEVLTRIPLLFTPSKQLQVAVVGNLDRRRNGESKEKTKSFWLFPK